MRLGNGPADGQAQPDARNRAFLLATHEFAEDLLFVTVQQPWAFVGDPQLDVIRRGPGAEADGSAWRRVLYGVFDQVDEDAFDQHGVDLNKWQIIFHSDLHRPLAQN